MLLYHFTRMKNVEAIQRDGIEAWVGQHDHMVGSLNPVVWLCDTPTLEATDAEMKEMREGNPNEIFVSKRWFQAHRSEPMARFTVVPSHDRALKQYGQWHRSKGTARGRGSRRSRNSRLGRRVLDTWWIYSDDIPPSKITGCIVEEAITYRPLQLAA